MKVFMCFSLFVIVLGTTFAPAYSSANGISATPAPLFDNSTVPFRTSGKYVVDKDGKRVKFACVNWYGAHMELYTVGGLQVMNLTDLVSRIVDLGFNCVRFPFSLQGYYEDPVVPASALTANPGLIGKTHLEIMDIIMQELADQQMMVVMNNHNSKAGWCCDPESEEGLWTTSLYSTDEWIDALEGITRRYVNFTNIVAFDLRNEIHDVGEKIITWGETNDKDTDWKVASELAGNRVLEANPDMLVIVTGVCFGFYIQLLQENPPDLVVKDKLVFTTHTYGFSTWYIKLPSTLKEQFGIELGWKQVQTAAIAATVVGALCILPFGIFSMSKDKSVNFISVLKSASNYDIVLTGSSWGFFFSAIFLISGLLWYEVWRQATCLGMARYPLLMIILSGSLMGVFVTSILVAIVCKLKARTQSKENELVSEKSHYLEEQSKDAERLGSHSKCCCCSNVCQVLSLLFLGLFLMGFGIFLTIMSSWVIEGYPMLKWDLDGAWQTEETVAPIWLGEFGNNKADYWFKDLIRYLKETDLDWAYWALNGLKWDEGLGTWTDESYGLLLPDYETVRQPELLGLLQSVQQESP